MVIIAHLGFECVVLPVMVWVPPPVAPLEGGGCRNVYILEMVVSSVAPISSWSRYGQTSGDGAGSVREGEWIAGDGGYQDGD